MGQAISQATYPILYSLYGATLPDLRGQFLRGLDYGRGVDSGRSILTEQGDAIRNITGSTGLLVRMPSSVPQSSGALQATQRQWDNYTGYTNSGGSYYSVDLDASKNVPTATENRVKNIAFLYIVKAG